MLFLSKALPMRLFGRHKCANRIANSSEAKSEAMFFAMCLFFIATGNKSVFVKFVFTFMLDKINQFRLYFNPAKQFFGIGYGFDT